MSLLFSRASPGLPPGRARTLLRVAAPFVAIMMLAVIRTSGSTVEDVGADAAIEQWDGQEVDSYTLTYSITNSLGRLGPATVVMEDGVLVSYETDDPNLEDRVVWTVDRLLAFVDEVEDDPAGTVDAVTFDPDLGHTVAARFDPVVTTTDDEWSFELLSFSRS